ncbi:hypothetical protein Nepgr_009680 [Nepenthes gracilis]|uniref:Homeobox-DDT domain protein RLT3 n=1 Tax=Nepenthes gracilis TaxID=150966 RepID=A0AAD3SBN3_NEPGR|nr:hypothetical protein Nepgr_009680 [Nepenthes gracilis]
MADHVQENCETSTVSPPPTDFNDTCSLKRKTPLQLQTLENLYSDDRYPTQSRIEDYAFALGLTCKQVRGWFIERRRKEKKAEEINESKKKRKKSYSSLEQGEVDENTKRSILMHDMLYSPDFILKKVFRKDGPPVGVEFDTIPSTTGRLSHDMNRSHAASHDEQRISRRRKVSRPLTAEHQQRDKTSGPVKKHGMGKGLMTVWRVTNTDVAYQDNSRTSKRRKVLPNSNNPPAKRHGIGKGLMTVWRVMHPNFADRGSTGVSQITSTRPRKLLREKRPRRKPISKQRRPGNVLQQKKKPPVRRRKVECNKKGNQKKSCREKCGLALDAARYEEHWRPFETLVDDEELELRELQSGSKPPSCTAHLATNGRHGCPFCKDLLAKFPPDSVRKKRLLCMLPWESSVELVKKLFKVFHFLYTYAVVIDVCPFTLDEFVQAFSDKDSLLLGKIHVCLLELLLSDVAKELSTGLFPCMTKNFMFLSLLHWVESQKFVVNFWKKSLNPLTWTEILRQVLVAAGFGSTDGMLKKGGLNKEETLIVKYGLRPGTLKGELFSILLEQGDKGIKVADLAKSSQIADLGFTNSNYELEGLLCSTLASDITLFEKISSSAYRLRLNSLRKRDEDTYSDSENSGSIDESSQDAGICNVDDLECDSGNSNSRTSKNISHQHGEINTLNSCTEIDESHSREVLLFGLMDGEYSDLSIEEKLNILVSLIDLVSAGSSIRMEDPFIPSPVVPEVYQHGSGAKIKRSSLNPHSFHSASRGRVEEIHGTEDVYPPSGFHSIDSSMFISLLCAKKKSSNRKRDANEAEVVNDPHPMQSIFLGSDRRYNRYWIFLGPCYANDPGHKQVYFESSEDGHWEVIDTEEALCALMANFDYRGRREAALLASLKKRSTFLFEEMCDGSSADPTIRQTTQSDLSELDRINEDSSSPVSDVDNNFCSTDISNNPTASSGVVVFEVGKEVEEQKQKLNRMQAHDSWIWNSFYSNLHAVRHSKRPYLDSLTRCGSCHDLYWRDEKHCKICHTTFELDFDLEEKYAIHVATCREKDDANMYPTHKVLPSQLQALKAAIHAIELAMPEAALIGAWTKSAHKLWVNRLKRTSSLPGLSQVLADFVSAINLDWLSQCDVALACGSTTEELGVEIELKAEAPMNAKKGCGASDIYLGRALSP